MKTITLQLLFAVLIAWLAYSQNAQAVNPPPDGGYPGGNTAEGQAALLSLTTGGFNTAVGFFSLRSDTTGQLNTGVGAGTLLANLGDSNTATGAGALLSNTTGVQNTATGAFALVSNTEANNNTANGAFALFSNTTDTENVANGTSALSSNTQGSRNTANGAFALNENTTGNDNTANGDATLPANTTGGFNTASGINALVNNIGGSSNTALGDSAGFNVTTANHVICIGANVQGENVSNTCYIGNIFGVTSSGGAGVFVNADGKLGTTTSSRRFKTEIKSMEQTSEMLYALKPVTFRYSKEIDSTGIRQLGLVAEDVEEVNPDLIVRDKDGKPYSVRYDQVNAMLLNEFLKEHRTVMELKKEIAALAEAVKDQAAQIQKVCAHLEIQRPNAAIAENQ